MNKLGFILLALFTLTSCNQDKIKTLEEKILELEKIIENQNNDILRLQEKNEEQYRLIKKSKEIRQYSNAEIINIVKKDREYYCPDATRKNFVVKKIDNNIYDVRFHLKLSGPYREFSPTTYRIQFLPNNKYKLDLYKGTLCI